LKKEMQLRWLGGVGKKGNFRKGGKRNPCLTKIQGGKLSLGKFLEAK